MDVSVRNSTIHYGTKIFSVAVEEHEMVVGKIVGGEVWSRLIDAIVKEIMTEEFVAKIVSGIDIAELQKAVQIKAVNAIIKSGK
jgi:hypothetical protein